MSYIQDLETLRDSLERVGGIGEETQVESALPEEDFSDIDSLS